MSLFEIVRKTLFEKDIIQAYKSKKIPEDILDKFMFDIFSQKNKKVCSEILQVVEEVDEENSEDYYPTYIDQPLLAEIYYTDKKWYRTSSGGNLKQCNIVVTDEYGDFVEVMCRELLKVPRKRFNYQK